ncbi:Gfo/Idh/MocA family oxidoreductase [Roseiconus nitratireducens]|uniref:Gfo/Idh/MocA family oxidoreductase n=1 Tax=Roseiconus nitratireducens TaxID=2605748 RepID=A0A5M6D0P1_9BACT|nr:Gfo/Idh/MocA family oxidoreductase [Roseiconus nitratireducens]KAA5539169.1 Gfo/Idh/MocA family oxidoreductase [Roseiconus nitratireducens]
MKPIEENARSDDSRREFLKTSGAIIGAGSAASTVTFAPPVHAAGDETIRLGLVGCGGRGTGAVRQALTADANTRLTAVADAFADPMSVCLQSLARQEDVSKQLSVDVDHRFEGFEGYRRLLDSDVDVVLLCTPPHFRPMHLRAALEAGKHVFAEKPVAVDVPGIRSVLESTEIAKEKGLAIVSGLNSRYSFRMQELMDRIHNGAIGKIQTLHAVRYAGGVWVRPREPKMTEMQYQMRNWYYFTWLSGDFNVEQFVHQYDQVSWALQGQTPQRCYSTGGRQARTGEQYGHIYDHFSSVFEFGDDVRAFMTTRHQRGCSNESHLAVVGTKGSATLSRKGFGITGENPWSPEADDETDSHQLEHDAFFAALRQGRIINNGGYMASSTMLGLLARMTAYTGQTLTWDQAMGSVLDLSPESYDWDAAPPPAEVAVPGVTPFV